MPQDSYEDTANKKDQMTQKLTTGLVKMVKKEKKDQKVNADPYNSDYKRSTWHINDPKVNYKVG